MQQTIDIIRGTNETIYIAVASADGEPYELSSSDKLRFGVKRNLNDDTFVIEKELTSEQYTDGVYMLRFFPEDTEGLDAGRYYYDCGLQSDDEYYMIIEKSHFNILASVTARNTNGARR